MSQRPLVDIEGALDVQRNLQLYYNNGKRIDQFTDEERMAEFRNNALALMAEIFEALDESGWKPWATSNHLNAKAFHGEMVDAFHFFMNLMLHAGMTSDDLNRGYVEKSQRNLKRQDEGYDGISGKCPMCKRALDDVLAHTVNVFEGTSQTPISRAVVRDEPFFYNGLAYCSVDCKAEAMAKDGWP